jgi:hypothetical protein
MILFLKVICISVITIIVFHYVLNAISCKKRGQKSSHLRIDKSPNCVSTKYKKMLEDFIEKQETVKECRENDKDNSEMEEELYNIIKSHFP